MEWNAGRRKCIPMSLKNPKTHRGMCQTPKSNTLFTRLFSFLLVFSRHQLSLLSEGILLLCSQIYLRNYIFFRTHEQKMFLDLSVFTLSSYILDNMVWYRILSWKYLKEIEIIALLYPITWYYLWSIDWPTDWSHLCVINFLCLNQFTGKILECFSFIGIETMHAYTPFFLHSFGQFGSFEFEEPCLASLGTFSFIIYLIVLFHLLVSFILLRNMFYLINTSIFNLLSDSSCHFQFFFSSALWESSIL